MKTIALTALIIMSTAAQAVVTKNCPEKLTVSIPKFYTNNVVDEDALADDDDRGVVFDGHNDFGIIELQRKLIKIGDLTLELELKYTLNSECSYRGADQNGDYASAVLFGSTRANAKSPATLKFYALSSMAGYISIDKVAQTGLTKKGNLASIYYRGEWCSWGDCVPDHIQVGNAQIILK